jgi:hypothetical protein
MPLSLVCLREFSQRGCRQQPPGLLKGVDEAWMNVRLLHRPDNYCLRRLKLKAPGHGGVRVEEEGFVRPGFPAEVLPEERDLFLEERPCGLGQRERLPFLGFLGNNGFLI